MAGGSANHPGRPGRQTFGLTVIDPRRFGGKAYYVREMKRFLARVKAIRPRLGMGRVRLPGERGQATLKGCQTRGVPLTDEKVGMLASIARANRIAEPW